MKEKRNQHHVSVGNWEKNCTLTLTSLIFRRSSIRRRSRIGRPLIELDGNDDRLPWRRRIPAPRVRSDSCNRPGKLPRLPSIFSTSPYLKSFHKYWWDFIEIFIVSAFRFSDLLYMDFTYICSRPSSCDRMWRMPCVSVSESLTDWVVPHAPPSNDSKSSDRVVFDVRSLSKPKTSSYERKFD